MISGESRSQSVSEIEDQELEVVRTTEVLEKFNQLKNSQAI